MYKLKDGVVLRPYGAQSKIDNSNLTDKLAEHLIKTGKAKIEDFEITKERKIKTKKILTKKTK
jgi:hypothetical protein